MHLRRFFDSAGDWLFLVDEAHNLPERARAMYSARFCKSSLTEQNAPRAGQKYP